MASNRLFKRNHLSLAVQQCLLIKRYPESTCYIKNNVLTWLGKIRPTAVSRIYEVKICYKQGYMPKVIVFGDNLKMLDESDFPHKFRINQEKKEVEICLYMFDEFNGSSVIADTIVIWAQEWLYFYEIWLCTGEWHGGGHGSPR